MAISQASPAPFNPDGLPLIFDPGKKEEITDMMQDKIYTERTIDGDFVFRKGKLLKFRDGNNFTNMKITRIDRKNKRVWAQHIKTFDRSVVYQHRRHAVDVTPETTKEYGVPFCTDCGVPVTEPSNEDGEVKALDRADRTLADGTPIE